MKTVRMYVRVSPAGRDATTRAPYTAKVAATVRPTASPLESHGAPRPTFAFSLDVDIPDSVLQLAHATVTLPEQTEPLKVEVADV